MFGNMQEAFGGRNIVFCGDFAQLSPPKQLPIYDKYRRCDYNNCSTFINQLNCYIELNGKWRFKDDPEYGEIMTRMRNDELQVADLQEINKKAHGRKPPEGVQIATYTNKNRDAINAAIFDDITKKSNLGE